MEVKNQNNVRDSDFTTVKIEFLGHDFTQIPDLVAKFVSTSSELWPSQFLPNCHQTRITKNMACWQEIPQFFVPGK
jgi:hypothetical protein